MSKYFGIFYCVNLVFSKIKNHLKIGQNYYLVSATKAKIRPENILQVPKPQIKRNIPIQLNFDDVLNQACKTGGPRAACGPIACPMRPAVISFKHKGCSKMIIFNTYFDIKGHMNTKRDTNISKLRFADSFSIIMWSTQGFEFDMPVLEHK